MLDRKRAQRFCLIIPNLFTQGLFILFSIMDSHNLKDFMTSYEII